MSPATQILRANGLTVTDVAIAAEMTPGAVSHVLCGRTRDASPVIYAIQALTSRVVALDVAGEIELARARRRRALRGEL